MTCSKTEVEITGKKDQIIDRKVSALSYVRILLRTDGGGDCDEDGGGCAGGGRSLLGDLGGTGRFTLLTLDRKVRARGLGSHSESVTNSSVLTVPTILCHYGDTWQNHCS